MLLAIDIGNSSTKFGIFDGDSLLHKFSIQTKRDYTAEELLFDRLKVHEQDFIQIDIDTCVVASVVPELSAVIEQVCNELFKITPRFVDAGWDFGFAIDYDPPSAAGVDRLVNCFAAAAKYGSPVVACSFGTATTIDIVSDENVYVGGIIAPGMATMAKALQLATSKLPEVTLTAPDAIIGKTTVTSIRSGIVNGHVAMIEGLLKRIGSSGKTVATGGFARMIASQTSAIDIVDENLTLEGLRLLALRDGVQRLASTH
ncbi:MAG TPA: type III pantothenate kinase [Pyrinomonadaceae bacterium]|nr:type III pantothenate kinase [Pyrinomonadaceae bacterium]